MPEKDLHLFDLTRLLAHECPVKPGHDSEEVAQHDRNPLLIHNSYSTVESPMQ
jgi:hypothetical protein